MDSLRRWWLENWRAIPLWWVAIPLAVVMVGALKLVQVVFGFDNGTTSIIYHVILATVIVLPLLLRLRNPRFKESMREEIRREAERRRLKPRRRKDQL